MPKTDQALITSNFLKLFTKDGLFPTQNIQVTSGTREQARSESIIAVNPQDRNNLIAASKKFSNPETYRFNVGIRVSYDSGENWQDATLPLLEAWNERDGDIIIELPGMTDPAAAFDDFGNAFMVGEPIHYKDRFGNVIDTIGMYIYKSTNGGLHWSEPFPLHVDDIEDDKSWIACDNSPQSRFYGNVYIVWGAEGSPLRFRRSTDHGASWKNFGTAAPEVKLADHASEPVVSIGLDGTVHIAWHIDGGNTIEYMRSTNGGETFEAQKSIVAGIHSLRGNLTEIGDPQFGKWPHFPGATFRVLTLATSCAFGIDPRHNGIAASFSRPKNFVVAWSDFREGAARIYYRTSSNAGASFEGPLEGKPLLGSQQMDFSKHDFHPQIVCTGNGVIGCAFYRYSSETRMIDVKLSASFDKGESFSYTTTVTDKPWDPSLDAPNSHGDKQVTFIGEYFGLGADNTDFDVLWTDTRTGVQELFFDRVKTEQFDPPASTQGIFAEILFGVIQGGGGGIFVNGHFTPIPPRGPEHDLVEAITALDAAGRISGSAGRALTKNVYAAIGAIAKSAEHAVRS